MHLISMSIFFSIAAPGIARNTFAVFMQPNVDHMLTPELSFHQFSEQVFARHYTDNDGVGV